MGKGSHCWGSENPTKKNDSTPSHRTGNKKCKKILDSKKVRETGVELFGDGSIPITDPWDWYIYPTFTIENQAKCTTSWWFQPC